MIDGNGVVTPEHREHVVNELKVLFEKNNREHSFPNNLSAIRVQLYASFDNGVNNPFGQLFDLSKLTGLRLDPGAWGHPAYLIIDEATDEEVEFAKLVLTDYGFLWCMAHKSFASY